MEQSEAEKIVKSAEAKFGSKFQREVNFESTQDVNILQLNEKTHYSYEQLNVNKAELNSALIRYYQKGAFNLKDSAVSKVLFQYLDEPTFNQLRT